MDNNDVKDHNPRAFWDGVCREEFTYTAAGALNLGNVVTSPITESFLGGPHAPVATSFNPDGSIPIGAADQYPKPWRSAQQKLTDVSNGSNIGPFARLLVIPETEYFVNTCCNQLIQACGGSDRGIWGRLGVGDGIMPGFRPQGWYVQSEGTYDTTYYNDQGTNWPTWKDWWANATKQIVEARWETVPGSPIVEVEVAYEDLGPGDGGYFPAPNLSGVAGNSYELLVGMVALAALTRF